MKSLLFITLLLAFAAGARAADTNAAASTATNAVPSRIGAAAAAGYYDREMMVTGRVARVSIRPTVTFLDLDKAYPDSPFTVVILHGRSHFYGNADALNGRAIEISGTIKNYHDKPEIILDDVRQLTVFDDWGNVITSAILSVTNAPAMMPRTNAVPPAKPSTNLPEVL